MQVKMRAGWIEIRMESDHVQYVGVVRLLLTSVTMFFRKKSAQYDQNPPVPVNNDEKKVTSLDLGCVMFADDSANPT